VAIAPPEPRRAAASASKRQCLNYARQDGLPAKQGEAFLLIAIGALLNILGV
jgi:hypothetical protein